MNVKAIIPLVAGLGIGGFALKVGIDTLQKAKGTPTETVQVWAAKTDIPRGTKITEEMLNPLAFPKKLIPSGALLEKDKVVGRVPRISAPGGLPILDDMLLAPGDPGGVHVPPGFRAVAVRIDEGSGVDFHLEPGSHVDVVGYFKVRKRGQQDTIARTLIENVEVAAVGPRVSAVTTEGGEKASRPTRAVTLLVKPDQVPTLHLAEQQGKIKLSMRGEEDAGIAGNSRVIREDEVLTGKAPEEEKPQDETPGLAGWFSGMFGNSAPEPQPVPIVMAAAMPVVEPGPPAEPEWVVHVWRGNKQEIVRFRNRDSRERVAEGEDDKSGKTRATPCSVQTDVKATQSAGQVSGPSTAASGWREQQESDQEQEDQRPEESLE